MELFLGKPNIYALIRYEEYGEDLARESRENTNKTIEKIISKFICVESVRSRVKFSRERITWLASYDVKVTFHYQNMKYTKFRIDCNLNKDSVCYHLTRLRNLVILSET